MSTFTTQGRTGRHGTAQWYAVTKSSCYIIEAKGGKGGDNVNVKGGYGASAKARVCLTKGQNLTIIVGQAGINSTLRGDGGGGGGGSFVYDANKSPPLLYVAAGGGGGCENAISSPFNSSGQASEDGQKAADRDTGGSGGHGGKHYRYGGAGAGWFSAGQSGSKSDPGQSRAGSMFVCRCRVLFLIVRFATF